jgi:type I restriction enzyme M protein
MSSQASSAGHGEKEVRRKLVETGDVDVMIAIRSNFFYTRTVPCELWFFDRNTNPSPLAGEGRGEGETPLCSRDTVLMLDARNIYRKVTRKIYDFSPEQQANLTAIVWLYRGQRDRFLGLVQDYLARLGAESAAITPALTAFETQLTSSRAPLTDFAASVADLDAIASEKRQPFADAMAEWTDAANAYITDRAALVGGLAAYLEKFAVLPAPTIDIQLAARHVFDPLAQAERGLIKQIDLLYKLAARAAQLAQELAGEETASEFFDRRAVGKLIKQLDEERKAAVEQLKAASYLHRQIAWLQDRFPRAEMQDVPGLCKVVSRAEIEAADWSLTPGRYVGVAPAEVDEDFDFEQTLRDIHVELADLNREAMQLAAKIQENFEELGV